MCRPDPPRGRRLVCGQAGRAEPRLLARWPGNSSHCPAVRREARRRRPSRRRLRPRQRNRPTDFARKSDFSISLGRRLAEWRRRGSAPALLMMRIDDFPALARATARRSPTLVLRSAVHSSRFDPRDGFGKPVRRGGLRHAAARRKHDGTDPRGRTVAAGGCALRLADRGPIGAIHGQPGRRGGHSDRHHGGDARPRGSGLGTGDGDRRQLHLLPQRPAGRAGPGHAGADSQAAVV